MYCCHKDTHKEKEKQNHIAHDLSDVQLRKRHRRTLLRELRGATEMEMKPFVKVLLALALLVVGGMVPFMPPLGLAILFFIACMAACIIITKKLTEKKKNKNT